MRMGTIYVISSLAFLYLYKVVDWKGDNLVLRIAGLYTINFNGNEEPRNGSHLKNNQKIEIIGKVHKHHTEMKRYIFEIVLLWFCNFLCLYGNELLNVIDSNLTPHSLRERFK